jgi:hypothetical protein
MGKILSIIVPAMLLAYYLKSSWPAIKGKKVLLGLLLGGTLIYYIGMLGGQINLLLGSTLQLLGTCLFFTAVAVNLSSRPPAKAPQQSFPQDEDSE